MSDVSRKVNYDGCTQFCALQKARHCTEYAKRVSLVDHGPCCVPASPILDPPWPPHRDLDSRPSRCAIRQTTIFQTESFFASSPRNNLSDAVNHRLQVAKGRQNRHTQFLSKWSPNLLTYEIEMWKSAPSTQSATVQVLRRSKGEDSAALVLASDDKGLMAREAYVVRRT